MKIPNNRINFTRNLNSVKFSKFPKILYNATKTSINKIPLKISSTIITHPNIFPNVGEIVIIPSSRSRMKNAKYKIAYKERIIIRINDRVLPILTCCLFSDDILVSESKFLKFI